MDIIKIGFEYDTRIIAEVKKIAGVRWSQSMRTWYIEQSRYDIDHFVQRLSSFAAIDSKELTYQKSQSQVALSSAKEEVRLPHRYLEKLQQKRYSDSTIKTYTAYFRDFVEYFEDRILDDVKVEEINAYLLMLIQETNMSSS